MRRAMSIASAPDGPLEFYIRYVVKPASRNPLTHLLWKLETGGGIYMGTTASGVFTIKETVGATDRLRVMVAAGTGVAPFVSMIRSEVCRNPLADLS